jgi:predicted small integral membrane protein
MVRRIKILLALAVALWGLLGGLGNLANYSEGMQSVASVLSRETLPESAAPEGPKNPGRVFVTLGFSFIWGLKLIGGALCLIGVIRMWKFRKSEVRDFAEAKRWAITGCGVLLFMLFFGFSLVAVGPFKLYLSPLVSAVELAALFAAQIGVVMIFLNQREAHLASES